MRSSRDCLLLRAYGQATALYPRPFRERHREQALITAACCYRDAQAAGRPGRFWMELSWDLITSLGRENCLHIRREIMKQPLVFHTTGLVLILTLLGGVAAVTCQQMLRRGADQPQVQMAENYSRQIARGASPQSVIPAGHIDIAESLEPFLIFYNDAQQPLSSNGFLDAEPPVPPAGVFAHTRAKGADKLTWQPRPGVRIATVTRRVDGPHPGFLLAGRSLRVVEEYEGLLRRMTIFGWLLVVAILTMGASLLTRARALPSERATPLP